MTEASLFELIEAARGVAGEFELANGNSAGSVGAALRTCDGSVHTGICIDLDCGLGFCAEVAAIARMLAHRETRIEAIVAVTRDAILPPCGRCRETIALVDPDNLDCRVIVSETEHVALRDLLPRHWRSGHAGAD